MSLVQENRAPAPAESPYRVMVVDDSAVIRGLLSRILEADRMVDVVVSASNGEQAVRALAGSKVEVIVLDIEMPVMDGLAALPKLLAVDSGVKIIMASTLTQRNAQISFKAMAAGATDYIPKPSASRDINEGLNFQRELREKVKVLGRAYRGARAAAKSSGAAAPSGVPATPARPKSTAGARWIVGHGAAISLRKTLGKRADVIVIGSSTGGPQALLTLFKDFDPSNRLPILLTQHMPPTFTTILAEHITRASGRCCAEATDGQVIADRHIYLAPGDWHMTVENAKSGKVLRLNQNPPVNFCRPAVDPLFESAASAYDGHVLSIILTGMGQDGLEGARKIVACGGTVIAQDEPTSVVWGMPGAVAMAGICAAILPLEKIGGYIRDFPRRVAS